MSALMGALALVGLAGQPTVAAAQSIINLPGGKYVYQVDYTSSATFTCSRWIVVGACRAFSNGVVLSNAGTSLALTWLPVTGRLNVSTAMALPFLAGSIIKSPSATPFRMPVLANPNGFLFEMYLSFTTGAGNSAGTPLRYTYGIQSSNSFGLLGSSTVQYLYPGFTWVKLSRPTQFTTDPGTVDILGTTGTMTTPEPATLALLSTGLGAFGGFMARRRKRAHSPD